MLEEIQQTDYLEAELAPLTARTTTMEVNITVVIMWSKWVIWAADHPVSILAITSFSELGF